MLILTINSIFFSNKFFCCANFLFSFENPYHSQKECYNKEMKAKTEALDNLMHKVEDLKKENIEVQQNLELKTREYLNSIKQISQIEKENSRLKKEIQFLERSEAQFKAPLSFAPRLSTTSTTSNYLNSANIHSEDEIGEVFDNNYLSELKNGFGGSQASIDSTYSASELQKRNSLYPQHMRESYAMCKIDRPISEHEIKVRIDEFTNEL